MKRTGIGIIFLILPLFLLCGCKKQPNESLSALNLTESIEVNCQYRERPFIRTYTNPEKIDVILLYLHRLSPDDQLPIPTEHPLGDRCEITVRLLNGTTRSYELRNKDQMRNASGNWYNVDPEKVNILYHLIEHIESDEPRVSQTL